MPDLIHVASEKGYLDVVKHLVNQNKSMLLNTYRDEMPIHIAARCGNVELLKYFINDCKMRPDKRCRGWGPLDFAIQAKNVASITYLSEMGADMNRTGNHRSRFDDIMQSRNKNMIYLLLSSGMSVPDYYASSNHLSEYDQTPIVPDELLKAFNNIPAPDPGRTDLESSRNLYLRDVRARTLEAYKESTDATLGKRADLTQELKDFDTLEDWIKKLKSLVNLPAQKTPALIKNIGSLSLICYNAYLVCLEKKSPKEAMTYLQKNCHAIIEASNAFLIDIPLKPSNSSQWSCDLFVINSVGELPARIAFSLRITGVRCFLQ